MNAYRGNSGWLWGLLVGLWVLVGWCLPAWAATYHVKKTGSNSNSCGAAQNASTPKLTIAAGIGCASSGDTILVYAGTYDERLIDIIPSGTSGNPTILKANGNAFLGTGDVVQIKPTNLVLYTQVIRTYDQNYITIDGFILDGTETFNAIVQFHGTSHHNTVQNCVVRNMIGRPGDANGGAGVGAPGAPSYITVKNTLIHNVGTLDGGSHSVHGIYFHGDHDVVEDVISRNNGGFGIHFYDGGIQGIHNGIIRRNISSGNGATGILYANGDDGLVYNNLVYNNGYGEGGQGVGIYVLGAVRTGVYNNTVYGNNGQGFLYEGTNGTIRNNIAYGNVGAAILDNGGSGLMLGNNLTGVDPLFVSPSGSDFRLAVGSPAISYGSNLSSLFTTDLLGTARAASGAWDAGAYTSGSAPVMTSTQVAFGTQPATVAAGATMANVTVRLEDNVGTLISGTDTVAVSLAGTLIPQTSLSVVSADSQDVGYERTKAIDGNTALFWHTQWTGAQPPHPHQIIINLGASYSVAGLTYQPRLDGQQGGNIIQYEVYVSADGATWGTAVASGSFTYQVKTHGISWTPKTGRYLRFVALSEWNAGGPYTNINELNVFASTTVAPGGTLGRAAVAGVATFNNLVVPTAGTYLLKAASGSLREAISSPFAVTPPPVVATKLAFLSQPHDTTAGATMDDVTVEIQDALNTRVTTGASSTKTITLHESTIGAAIAGTLSRAAVAGLATFTGLSIAVAGSNLQFDAEASALTSARSTRFSITAPPAPQIDTGLLTSNSLTYVGAFRLGRNPLPLHTAGTARYWSNSSGPIAYHPTRKTLYAAQLQGYLLEMNIPPPKNNVALVDLNTVVTFAQGAIDPTGGQWANLGPSGASVTNGAILGGIAFNGGRMVLSAVPYYAPASAQVTSHSTASPRWSLDGGQWGGWQAVGATNKGGFVGGWMLPIPSTWQASLGGPWLTGQGAIPIIDRTSYGPALSIWDPSQLGVIAPVPATPALEYPSNHTTLGGYSDAPSLLFNRTTAITGAVWPTGTRSILFFGSIGVGQTGLGDTCYGDRTLVQAEHNTIINGERVCYDPANGDKGPHGYPYISYVLAYDANDLLAVRLGTKQPWEPVPYATWELTLPFAHAARKLSGVTYDEANRKIYLGQEKGDVVSGQPTQPLIHVLSVTIP